MNQIREAYGESLNDPQVILELTVALGTFRTPVHGSAATSGGVSRSAG
jgi:hypothetical protein